MSDKEVMQQALDALLECYGLAPLPIARRFEAIAALRAAIAQPVPPAGQLCEDAFGRGQVMWFNKPVDGAMLYASPSIAQPVQPTDAELLRNVTNVERRSDQSVTIVFTSCRAASEFWRAAIASKGAKA